MTCGLQWTRNTHQFRICVNRFAGLGLSRLWHLVQTVEGGEEREQRAAHGQGAAGAGHCAGETGRRGGSVRNDAHFEDGVIHVLA